MNIRISAVVITHDRANYLRRALRGLAEQTLPSEQFEIVVVDNASPDDTRSVVRDEFAHLANLRYVYEPTIGCSPARNTGFREARGEFVAYLDDDAIPARDWLQRLLEVFDTVTPRPGCVGGRIDPIWEVPQPVWLHDLVLPLLTVLNLSPTPMVLRDDQFLGGANFAFPRAVLEQLGGFPVGLGREGDRLRGNEDTFPQHRLRALGYTCYYHPDAGVSHHVHASRLRKDWFLRRLFWQGVSNAAELIHVESLSAAGRLRHAALEAVRLLLAPRYVANMLIPTDDPGRFMIKGWTVARLGFILRLIGLYR